MVDTFVNVTNRSEAQVLQEISRVSYEDKNSDDEKKKRILALGVENTANASSIPVTDLKKMTLRRRKNLGEEEIQAMVRRAWISYICEIRFHRLDL